MKLYEKIINHYYNEPKLKEILTVHSRKVAEKALDICRKDPELELNPDVVENAAMLHDIGIVRCDAAGIECFGKEPYLCHGRIGAGMLREDADVHGAGEDGSFCAGFADFSGQSEPFFAPV